MEFKGTSGKWTYEYDGDGMRFCEISCFIDDTYENYKEDALLISKAPEILKELVNEVEILKAMGLGDTERCKRKERLIKEATEI